MNDIFNYSLTALRNLLAEWNEPGYRAAQVLKAVWSDTFSTWQDISTLPLGLRQRLEDTFHHPCPLQPSQTVASDDHTCKVLFRFSDGVEVESVAIPKDDRLTFCLSTQAGCAMGCTFCATARLGFQRHLTCGEIIAQARGLARHMGRRPTNLVLMGMGEPLQNLDAVRDALELFGQSETWNWSNRRSVVSTSGWVPGIEAITQHPLRAKLALSLNAVQNHVRSRIMPINQRYPLEVLLNTVRNYTHITGNQVWLEYILIANLNDSPEDARALALIAKNLHSKINLIPLNPGPGLTLRAPDASAIEAFTCELRAANVIFTQRSSRGANIGAACGQLAGRRYQAAA